MRDLWDRSDLRPDWRIWIATRKGVMVDKDARLFACWCVRQVWHLLTDDRSKTAVETAERFAHGLASRADLAAAAEAAREAAAEAVAEEAAVEAACAAVEAAGAAAGAAWAAWEAAVDSARAAQAAARAAEAAWKVAREAQCNHLKTLSLNLETLPIEYFCARQTAEGTTE